MSQRPRADFVLQGASELVTCAGEAPAAGEAQARVAVIEEGAVAACGGRVVWTGPQHELARAVDLEPGAVILDAGDRAVLPGLVDSHTHAVWGGHRAHELELRLAGATYSEIAAAGGGILSTVTATREASEEELVQGARARLARMMRLGTTAVEIKSGYGLNTETELKLLRAARAAARATPLAFATTFLGAHTLPVEARDSAAARARHLDTIVEEMIPLVVEERLAEFADVFIDEHAFTLEEARRVLEAAKSRGLRLKVHTGQLARDGGMLLAAELGATSADHLEYASDEDLEAIARASVVGVLLPGATLFLRMDQWAPGRRMVSAGVPVAVATDVNPGSCPSESLPLMMQLACLRCGLSIDEAIVAATLNAAAACGLESECGSLEPGKRCDLLVIDAKTRAEIVYALGSPRTHMVVAEGRVVA